MLCPRQSLPRELDCDLFRYNCRQRDHDKWTAFDLSRSGSGYPYHRRRSVRFVWQEEQTNTKEEGYLEVPVITGMNLPFCVVQCTPGDRNGVALRAV